MKIRFSKKVFVFLGVFAIGVGMGIGSLVLKDHFFPDAATQQANASKKSEEIGPLIEMKEFLINLNGGGMLKTEITIEGNNAKSEEKIKAKEVFLRDRILAVIGSKGLSDIRPIENREALKNELITALNEICKDEVKDVLFKNFVYSF